MSSIPFPWMMAKGPCHCRYTAWFCNGIPIFIYPFLCACVSIFTTIALPKGRSLIHEASLICYEWHCIVWITLISCVFFQSSFPDADNISNESSSSDIHVHVPSRLRQSTFVCLSVSAYLCLCVCVCVCVCVCLCARAVEVMELRFFWYEIACM